MPSGPWFCDWPLWTFEKLHEGGLGVLRLCGKKWCNHPNKDCEFPSKAYQYLFHETESVWTAGEAQWHAQSSKWFKWCTERCIVLSGFFYPDLIKVPRQVNGREVTTTFQSVKAFPDGWYWPTGHSGMLVQLLLKNDKSQFTILLSN